MELWRLGTQPSDSRKWSRENTRKSAGYNADRIFNHPIAELLIYVAQKSFIQEIDFGDMAAKI